MKVLYTSMEMSKSERYEEQCGSVEMGGVTKSVRERTCLIPVRDSRLFSLENTASQHQRNT